MVYKYYPNDYDHAVIISQHFHAHNRKHPKNEVALKWGFDGGKNLHSRDRIWYLCFEDEGERLLFKLKYGI